VLACYNNNTNNKLLRPSSLAEKGLAEQGGAEQRLAEQGLAERASLTKKDLLLGMP